MVNTMAHPGNLNEMEELGDWITASAANCWRIALALPSGRAKGEDRFCLNDGQIRWVLDFIRRRRKRFPVMLSEEVGYLGPWDLKVRPVCGGGKFGMRVGDRHCNKRLWNGGGNA